MTRSLYKGLQCSKSREEVEQSYSECNYEVASDEVSTTLRNTYQRGDFTMTWGGVDITKGWVDETFIEVKPKRCEFNDCGWCYYKGDESNDNNGQCNNAESCEINYNKYIYKNVCDEDGYEVIEYSQEYNQVVYNMDDGYGGVTTLSEGDLMKMLEMVRAFKEGIHEKVCR